MTQAEIRGYIRRVQDDLYFGTENVRVVLGRMDERLGNTATREDFSNMEVSVIMWFIGSMLSLAGVFVAALKWILT